MSIARTAASVAGIIAAFGLVLYLTYGDGGGDSDPAATSAPSAAVEAATPTGAVASPPTASAPPTASSRPAPLPDPPERDIAQNVTPLTQGDPAEMPEDVAILVGQRCRECDDVGYSAIYRVYRDTGGDIRMERSFPPLNWAEMKVTSLASGHRGGRTIVAACVENACGERMPGGYEGDQTMYRSEDGGVTWEEVGSIPGDAYVAAVRLRFFDPRTRILGDRIIIGYRPIERLRGHVFQAYPDGDRFMSRGSGTRFQTIAPGVGPVWLRRDGTVIDVGSNRIAHVDDAAQIVSLAGYRQGAAVTLLLEPASEEYYLQTRDRRFSSLGVITVVGQVGTSSLAGNADVLLDGEAGPRNVPVIIEPGRATIAPIRHFTFSGLLEHRYDVLAVRQGPFARVTSEGCLNVRLTADRHAEVLDCIAPGVLLVSHATTIVTEGEAWLAVRLSDGRDGWAAAEFLGY